MAPPDHLTLFQLGGRLCLPRYYQLPRISRSSYGPGLAVPAFALHTYFVLYVCSLQHLSHMKILLMVSKSKSICHQNDFLAWRFAIITSSLLHLQDRRNWGGSGGPRGLGGSGGRLFTIEAKPPPSNELFVSTPPPLPPVLISKYVLYLHDVLILLC